MKWRILISEPVAEEALTYLKKNDIEIKHGSSLDQEVVLKELYDCDAVMVRVMKITREMMIACPKLKVIAKHGTGCDSIDTVVAKELGIPVVFTPGANSRSVAELTMTLILSCAKQLRQISTEYAQGNPKIKNQVLITELAGKTLGLIGCGKIAQLVAGMACLGFNMRVIGFDPFLRESDWPENIERSTDMEQLIRESDYVSLHIPATPENIGIISKREINWMKKGAFLINTARGQLVCHPDLIEALESGRIAGAALDVSDPEPLQPDSKLFSMKNVLLTPHCGASSAESMVRMGLLAAQGVVDVLNGRQPEYPYPG